MTEKPLERLNYFNGQRLEASDLRLEQEYHIRVRRWLNKSLYSAGIAEGLEVTAIKGEPAVVVSPGLALDDDGHEIILWKQETVKVVGDARHRLGTGSEAEVEGLYLTVRYNELLTAVEPGGCVPPAAKKNGNRYAAGGPSRVLAKPLFAWRAFLPSPSSGEVVLAQVELDNNCKEVHQINADVRRPIGAASAAKVRQYALEGSRDFDNHNPQRIYFHIRGRQPNAVTLYLRADKLSTLFYTEMGYHNHKLDIQLQGADGAHRHDLGAHTTVEEPDHSHSIADDFLLLEQPDSNDFAQAAINIVSGGIGALFTSHSRTVNFNRIALTPQYHWVWSALGNTVASGDYPTNPMNDANIVGGPFRVAADGKHSHGYGSIGGVVELTKDADANSAHTHAFSSMGAASAGVTDPSAQGAYQAYSARSGDPLAYGNGLQVSIGKNNVILDDYTQEILRQLSDGQPSDWFGVQKLGDGMDNHVLVEKGTGEIRLDFLPHVHFDEGEYFIQLELPSGPNGEPNGGRILYNLYVE